MHTCLPRARITRTTLTGLLAVMLLCGAGVGPAQAVDKFAAEFLKIGVGARALGMGGSFVSLANDATAAYWNPAGLVQIQATEAMGMYASQFGGVVNHNVLGVTTPINDKKAAVGATLILLSVDDIRVTKDACQDNDLDGQCDRDANGNPLLNEEDIRLETAYDLALLLSYAQGLGDRWSLGVNVKVLRQSLVGEGASFGIGADLGFLFHASPRLAVGLRLADITTTQLFWDTGRNEVVAPTVTLGASTTQNLAALAGTLTLGLDANFAFEGQGEDVDQFSSGNISGNLLPGAEYWFRDTLALRVGSDGGNFTAGAGVQYKKVGADYAYLDHPELDSTHRVSALIRF